MRMLGALLQAVTDHGYQLLLAGLVAAFLIRNPGTRRKFVRAMLVLGGIVVGCVFVAAAYGKMKPLPGMTWSVASVKTSLAMFAIQVDSYQILSPGVANTVAHSLPYFELFLGLWLLSSVAQRISAVVASLAIIGFMIAITSAYARGLKIDCGCGIGPPEEAGPAALLRDGLKFLLPAILVAIGAFWIRRNAAKRNESAAAMPATDVAG